MFTGDYWSVDTSPVTHLCPLMDGDHSVTECLRVSIARDLAGEVYDGPPGQES